MKRALISAIVLLAMALVPLVAAEQWPQFRGPRAGVAVDDPALPDRWSETENVVWKTPIPGLGWSSPIVWDDHVFLTAAISLGEEPAVPKGLYDPGEDHGKMKSPAAQRWMVYDVDFRTGKIRWQQELRRVASLTMRHVKNSFASETPVTDGERVYVYFGSLGVVAAVDFQGRIAWAKEVGAYDGRQAFGMAASPIVYKDRVYIVNDNATESFIAAFNKRNGSEVWRVKRDEVENWASPFIWENGTRTEIITSGMRRVRSYDLDGKLLWELSGMTGNTVPTPFASNGLLYINSGYPGSNPRPVYAIKPGARGDISLKPGEKSNDYIVWYQPLLGTYTTSSLVYGDYYYTLLDRGFLLCHEAATGKEVYGRQRITMDTSGFTASPWAYNGKVFALSEDGETFVMEAGPKFKLVGKNVLNDTALATPAIARGSLIIRTQSNLYRIGSKP